MFRLPRNFLVSGWTPFSVPTIVFLALAAHVASGFFEADDLTKMSVLGLSPIPAQKIIGAEGPKWVDVRMGKFGNCYFFAVLAAIANEHPRVIEDAFVKKELWPQGIYTMKFLINGAETFVAVNGMIPTKIVSTQTQLWPVLLEKAYAKIFGSYKAMEDGIQSDAIKAIAQAPVTHHRVDDGSDREKRMRRVWNTLVEAKSKHWPISASSIGDNAIDSVGVARNHAFVILDVREEHPDAQFSRKGRVVHLYNPFGTYNEYIGNLSTDDTKRQGDFWMTFEEFFIVYGEGSIFVAHMERGYQVSAQALKLERGKRRVAISFKMAKDYVDNRFYVQLEWPEARLLPATCEVPAPQVTMLVAPRDDLTDVHVARHSFFGQSSIRATINGSAGEYIFYLDVEFPRNLWMNLVVVNIYSAESVRFKKPRSYVRDPLLLPEQMFRLCPRFSVKNTIFQREAVPLNGMPSYKKENGDLVLWFNPLNYGEDRTLDVAWKISSSRAEAEKGNSDKTIRFEYKFDVQCLDPSGLIEEEVVCGEAAATHTVLEIAAAPAANDTVVQTPLRTPTQESLAHEKLCESLTKRSRLLGYLWKGAYDPDFPETADSITRHRSGEKCGDRAQDVVEQCEKYSVWGRMESKLKDS